MTNDQPAVMPGAEPWSHTAPDRDGRPAPGFLTLHGFTGNPSSMRAFAQAAAGAGFNVDLPRLPGHGTSVEDMMTTGWSDWTAAAEAAYEQLAGRSHGVVIAGLSMGGSLALWLGLHHPDVPGLVCVNPATEAAAPDVRQMVDEMMAAGTDVMPGIGSDIADPDAHEVAYEGTPLPPLVSLIDDGLTPLSKRYGELHMPLLLFSSVQDHVIDPTQGDYLAEHYGGPVDRRRLERSYHVATQDFDRDTIFLESIAFAERVLRSP